MMPKNLNEKDLNLVLLNETKPVIVNFYSSKCKPCKDYIPALDKAEVNFGDKAIFVEIDTEKYQGLSNQYGIKKRPTLVLFKQGDTIDFLPKLRSYKELSDWTGLALCKTQPINLSLELLNHYDREDKEFLQTLKKIVKNNVKIGLRDSSDWEAIKDIDDWKTLELKIRELDNSKRQGEKKENNISDGILNTLSEEFSKLNKDEKIDAKAIFDAGVKFRKKFDNFFGNFK